MLCHQVFFIILFLFLLYFSILPRFLRFVFFTSFSLEFMRTVCVIYDKKKQQQNVIYVAFSIWTIELPGHNIVVGDFLFFFFYHYTL